MYDIIIRNGTVIDGTGERMFTGDIGIREGKILEVGRLDGIAARKTVDAADCYVTPGFIDITNHTDTYWQLFSPENMESMLRQGVTTIIGGNSGTSLAPFLNRTMIQTIQKWVDIQGLNLNWLSMAEFLREVERRRLPINFGTLVGHTTLRRGVLNDVYRQLEPADFSVMQRMFRQAMKEGALGISFGLAYAHAREASRPEIVTLMEQAKKAGGLCSIHLRDESDQLVSAVEEALMYAQASGASLHISHLKASGERNWPLLERSLYLIETAQSGGTDVTFDVYPYRMTASVLYTLLPEWAAQGGKRLMLERLKDPNTKREVILELQQKKIDYSKVTVLISPVAGSTVRHNVAELAVSQDRSPEEVIVDMLVAGGGRAIVSFDTLSEHNIEKEVQNPFSCVSSNGVAYSAERIRSDERVHPRNFGTFPRLLGRYVREKKLLSWEEAVHKATGKPAGRLGLSDRGVLRKGAQADIVVFRPDEIEDTATMEFPYRYPRGIRQVVVNGEIVVGDGAMTDARPGQVIRRHPTPWWKKEL